MQTTKANKYDTFSLQPIDILFFIQLKLQITYFALNLFLNINAAKVMQQDGVL